MIKAYLILLIVGLSLPSFAQIKIIEGPYTSPDGKYTIEIKQDQEHGTFTTIEPNRSTVYQHLQGNEYAYTHTNGVEYRIMVINDRSFQSYHPGLLNSVFVFTYAAPGTVAATSSDFVDYKKVAEKYKDKMETDPDNIQTYAFCAAAAIARGMYNDEGFAEYCKKVVESLKLIVTDKTKCPCEDAIPKTIWDSVTTQP